MAFDFSNVQYIQNGESFDESVLNRPIEDIVNEIDSSLNELYSDGVYPWDNSETPYASGISVTHNGEIWTSTTSTSDEPTNSSNDWVRVLDTADLTDLALSGNPTAPTQPAGNNSQRIANTQYVRTELSNMRGADNTWTGINVWNSANREDTRDLSNDNNTIDWEVANLFYQTFSGDVTLSETNKPPNGQEQTILLKLTNAGPHAITFPASWEWPGGNPPPFSSGTDLVVATCSDGSTVQASRVSGGGFS